MIKEERASRNNIIETVNLVPGSTPCKGTSHSELETFAPISRKSRHRKRALRPYIRCEGKSVMRLIAWFLVLL